MPYCFPRSSIKFQGHTVQNITDFYPNWEFPDYRSVAAFKSLRFALSSMRYDQYLRQYGNSGTVGLAHDCGAEYGRLRPSSFPSPPVNPVEQGSAVLDNPPVHPCYIALQFYRWHLRTRARTSCLSSFMKISNRNWVILFKCLYNFVIFVFEMKKKTMNANGVK